MNNISEDNVVRDITLSAREPIIEPTGADMSDFVGITRISQGAFYGSTGLTGALVLPPTITRIGTDAFQGCNQLESIHLTNLPFFENDSFRGCTNLKSIYVPHNVELHDDIPGAVREPRTGRGRADPDRVYGLEYLYDNYNDDDNLNVENIVFTGVFDSYREAQEMLIDSHCCWLGRNKYFSWMYDSNSDIQLKMVDNNDNIRKGVSMRIRLQELNGDEYEVLYNSIDTVNPGNEEVYPDLITVAKEQHAQLNGSDFRLLVEGEDEPRETLTNQEIIEELGNWDEYGYRGPKPDNFMLKPIMIVYEEDEEEAVVEGLNNKKKSNKKKSSKKKASLKKKASAKKKANPKKKATSQKKASPKKKASSKKKATTK